MPLRRAFAVVALFLVCSLPLSAQTFVFDLRGSQEVPPVPSTASGGCHGVLDQGAGTFALTCVHDVANATVMHIHRGAAGVNGTIAFDMGDPALSPVIATWSGMTPADISDLLAGNLYLNIHTAGRPAGEIRGQILPRTVDLVAFDAEGSEVVPPNESAATANCTADLDVPATSLAIHCTHDLAGASAAHVHEAPFGTNGPIVFTFPSAASPLSANVPVTPRLVAGFAATFLYLDIHTPGGTEESPSEEIRGQIGDPPQGAGTGTILIEKQTEPAGGTAFGFTETITPGTFSLDDGNTETFASVAPGAYTVTENDPSGAGYTLADVTCNDADSSGDTSARTANINLAAGETVRCTFRNLQTSPTDTIFVFHLSGDQEQPPVSTLERGGCMARFDAGASELAIVCTHNVDLPTVMHIHRNDGTILFDMGEPASPVITTWSGMTPAQVADLLAGNLYVNIHTAGRPAGVIRGQIEVRTVDTIAFPLDGAQVVPSNSTTASGNCTADLSNDATSLAVNCTHDVASPDAAHVHQAPRGHNGPIAFTFPSAASPINAAMPMTPRLVADFAAYFLYVDVHGPEIGESTIDIRGQIGAPVVVPTTGTIRIRKTTSPSGGGPFAFTSNLTPANFSISDGGEQLFLDVPAGTYSVTESVLSGWSVTNISCGDSDSSGNVASRTATIQLQGGESVTCTFTNLQSVSSAQHYVFHLSADQEVPPTDSTARGGCYAQLDPSTRRLSLVCTHNVDSPAVAHIHRGAAGAIGPPLFDLGDPSSPIEATWEMTPADVADLQAGNLYLNIHAAGRPDGEIRGQMLPRTIDRISFDADASQEVPPTDSNAIGQCIADLASTPAFLNVSCSHNVPSPTSTHLHVAPPGVDGPVVFDFANTSPFSASVPLSPRLVADYAAGFLYVNIHSEEYEQGEIRGQLFGVAAPANVNGIPTLGEWSLLALLLGLALLAAMRVRG
ncbi:MAG TPA: CHRD domain-containing protein [Thermoanaerobaculia bacterium]|nr:CHRD domain-containing protein [Thermoanaerobaculia bacterium]